MSHRAAVTTIFLLNGAVFSSWYARLPAIQADLDIRPGALGLALLGAPAGLLVAQPLVGALVARRGSAGAPPTVVCLLAAGLASHVRDAPCPAPA